ncbi:YlmC/YmxH family sporulation protein [Jeotgalibacillus salarius]|uniref:YlmC/YmxH family sporulation protein n=1 Tax=Jeotgalibacillus salarius TaxID=546023 RepID=A0A4Y8LI45_9BACL|nr:YlmC/YmxH family sporulation protein [Jeotgalibacillus salarius]TFE02684.1 YlmC/YmxH family sporulation protein [Jeotgalibacillus salarius]
MMRISDLQSKDVVSITDGKKLGLIADIDLNVQTGMIDSFVLQSSGGWFNRGEEVRIKWKDVAKIGNDVILVRNIPQVDGVMN